MIESGLLEPGKRYGFGFVQIGKSWAPSGAGEQQAAGVNAWHHPVWLVMKTPDGRCFAVECSA